MYHKKSYVINIRAMNQALDYGLILEKVHRVIESIQEAWFKLYMRMNTELRTKVKNDFERDFFKLMNNSVFRKTIQNIRKHQDIKHRTANRKESRLISKPNYYKEIVFRKTSGNKMNKAKVKMNKPVYLGLSVLGISKIPVYEYWYAHKNPKYGDKTKLSYMNADRLMSK